MVDNLLPDLVELPHVLDLTVHLSTWMGRGGSYWDFFPFWTFWGGMGGGGPCDFSVTPSPNWTWILDWFWIGSRTTGIEELGLGLENNRHQFCFVKNSLLCLGEFGTNVVSNCPRCPKYVISWRSFYKEKPTFVPFVPKDKKGPKWSQMTNGTGGNFS